MRSAKYNVRKKYFEMQSNNEKKKKKKKKTKAETCYTLTKHFMGQ